MLRKHLQLGSRFKRLFYSELSDQDTHKSGNQAPLKGNC